MFKFLILLILPFAAFPNAEHSSEWVREYLSVHPDYPKPGILFQWMGPLLRNPAAFDRAIEEIADHYRNEKIDAVLGLEARGFILGAALAQKLGVAFIPVRKPGKLPGSTLSSCYEKEYGPDCLEIEIGALASGNRVVIVDDLIATGGTALAGCDLAARSGAEVIGVACLIELPFLHAREKLPCPLFTLLKVDGD